MWEALGNWLTKRFSSPLPILFFVLGAVLIIIEAVEVELPNGTFVRHDGQIGIWSLRPEIERTGRYRSQEIFHIE